MVPTLEKFSGWARVSRGANWCQAPPAPLGLLPRSQLAPSPGATQEGFREGEAMFILLLLVGSQELGVVRSLLPQLGTLGASKELALGLSPRT